jgi:hypothetical protein
VGGVVLYSTQSSPRSDSLLEHEPKRRADLLLRWESSCVACASYGAVVSKELRRGFRQLDDATWVTLFNKTISKFWDYLHELFGHRHARVTKHHRDSPLTHLFHFADQQLQTVGRACLGSWGGSVQSQRFIRQHPFCLRRTSTSFVFARLEKQPYIDILRPARLRLQHNTLFLTASIGRLLLDFTLAKQDFLTAFCGTILLDKSTRGIP